jgi:mono/diheme cytochrome c family protein/glucose/arabinose dehydrogenase
MLPARLLYCFCAIVFLAQCTDPEKVYQETSSPPKSPKEALGTFQLDPGFEIQLVASEPMVQDPIFITFDEDGRLWVLEMRGFMPDIDGEGENQPTGRISVLEDLDGDGTMDKSTIYLDSLVLPRALGLFHGGALVAENNALWLTKDLNGDLIADSKTLLDSTYAQNGIPEHSDNGLLRNADNWYYNAKSKLRYRLQNGEWIRDHTEARGQWGLSQDDEGRLVYNYNWSQLHADLVPPNYLSRNRHHQPSTGIDHGLSIDRRIYPIRPNWAVNRGYIPGALDEKGRLLEFTAACSPVVLRTTAFPQDYQGNILVCEPAGNLIKRNVIRETGNLLEAFDPNPGREFLASTDERFRPVHQTVGPDGMLYIADMYRGLIQHGSYVTPYLREQTLNRDLVLPIHMGRIWRVVPKKAKIGTPPKLSLESDAALVQRLSHPDGWHRDMAQRLLVERGNPNTATLLEAVLQSNAPELAKFHALWTLEGINKINEKHFLKLLENPSALLHNTALRILEQKASLEPTTKAELEQLMLAIVEKADPKRALQFALSAGVLTEAGQYKVLTTTLRLHGDDPLIRDAVMSSLGENSLVYLKHIWQVPEFKIQEPAHAIFLENLTAAIMKKRDEQELVEILDFLHAQDPERGWREATVLSGLAIAAGQVQSSGAIQLSSQPALFKRASLPLAQSRLETLKNSFSWPGFKPKAAEVSLTQLDEKAMVQFANGRQKYLNTCAGCHGMDGLGIGRMGPPLAHSEWVTGDEVRLSLIILHGMEGPLEISGKQYDAPDILPIMPAHATLDDASIAAILTYIRNEWGNQAAPVTGRTVGITRHTNQGRVYPWTATELNKHMETLSLNSPK